MQVNSTTMTADTAPKTNAAAKQATVDYDSFLRLLIAQIKNQDPTNPTDSTQFLAQLASFSAVEQGIQTNARLDALLTSSLLAQADSVIGRTVTSMDGAISGKVVSVTIGDGGLVATIEGGGKLPMNSGVTVR